MYALVGMPIKVAKTSIILLVNAMYFFSILLIVVFLISYVGFTAYTFPYKTTAVIALVIFT